MTVEVETIGAARIYRAECQDVLPLLSGIDAVITDPPYHLTQNSRGGHARSNNPDSPHGRHRIGDKGFMGKQWDGGDVAFRAETWSAVLNALKPGAHVVAFGGTRTYHRMVCAIEDAGFEIRDCLAWIYSTGFPKSKNLEGEWDGWGTALKPAFEPIVLARKPIPGTVAANVAQFGTGALNIDGCRVGTEERTNPAASTSSLSRKSRVAQGYRHDAGAGPGSDASTVKGRWPANVLHDGSDDVIQLFPKEAGAAAPVHERTAAKFRHTYSAFAGNIDEQGSTFQGDVGSAARFFYCPKVSPSERADNTHPTLKPVALMRWLCELITPPGGTVLDLFSGSGSTGVAAVDAGFRYVGIEREQEYFDIQRRRLAEVQKQQRLFA